MSGSTLLSSVYGYEVSSYDDGLVKVVENAVHRINFYVNTIVWMKYIPAWMPGAAWKRTANAWRRDVQEMVNVPYSWAKDQIVFQGYRSPFNPQADAGSVEGWGFPFRRGTAATRGAYSVGDVATVIVFVLAMVLHPEVQAKAQAEIDSVLGGTRLPEMTDRESLPYVCCIVKEVLRWWPAFPLGELDPHSIDRRHTKSGAVGVPHASTQDDVYRGYFIPKGSTVAICNDPNLYPNPERFYPDRFLDPSVPNAPGFGYGRRSCPGVHFAESTLFITMCTLLTVFDISPALDENGNLVLPKVEKGPNLMISYPQPFKCRIAPRSEKHEGQIVTLTQLEGVLIHIQRVCSGVLCSWYFNDHWVRWLGRRRSRVLRNSDTTVSASRDFPARAALTTSDELVNFSHLGLGYLRLPSSPISTNMSSTPPRNKWGRFDSWVSKIKKHPRSNAKTPDPTPGSSNATQTSNALGETSRMQSTTPVPHDMSTTPPPTIEDSVTGGLTPPSLHEQASFVGPRTPDFQKNTADRPRFQHVGVALKGLCQSAGVFPPLQAIITDVISCFETLEIDSTYETEYEALLLELQTLSDSLAYHVPRSNSAHMSDCITRMKK
ncbi:cytochrome P450 [Rhizoctonia solani AG-1 IA]|uniref:Cytochrome P450 n=1 Tax=Thanatephorus cucumeris (strain AG1-IA) TaxID=983506 RepID=L8WIN9_THACA|nr:cytochrome P450 [Rhizoctonia solani AG-1 IA]